LIDIWRLFAEKTGVEIDFQLVDWAESLELMRSEDADIHGGLIESPARGDYLDFGQVLFRIRSLVFASEHLPTSDLQSMSEVSVGVVKSSYEEEFVNRHFPEVRLTGFPNSDEMIRAAVVGNLQAFITDYPTGYYHLIAQDSLDRFVTGQTLFTRPLRAGIRKGDQALQALVRDGFSKVSRVDRDWLYRRWFIPRAPIPAWVLITGVTAVVSLLVLAAAVHYLALRRTVRRRTADLEASVEQLKRANDELDRLARTDALTGLPNRLAFFEVAAREIERAKRYDRSLSLALLDLDHFKRINDRYGHSVGDAVLRHFAGVVEGNLRTSDVFARIGGEEFAVLLPETMAEGAYNLVQRLLGRLTGEPYTREDGRISVSFSAGIAEQNSVGGMDELIGRADAALYASKASGRGRVSVAGVVCSGVAEVGQGHPRVDPLVDVSGRPAEVPAGRA
jgi:diguanylate cyclase (GGDEF)-like protein